MDIRLLLEAAIGLVFTFLIIGVMVTAVNELVASMLSLRSKQLEDGIRRMLGGDAEMLARFKANPLISLGNKKDRGLPSAIPKEHFAAGVIGLLSVAVGDLSSPGKAGADGLDLVEAIKGTPFPEEVKLLLESFARSARNQVEGFQAKVESWFDSMMKVVSEWYARKLKCISFCIGLILACAANIDTIAVADRLASDEAARGQVLIQALDYLKANTSEAPSPKPEGSSSPAQEKTPQDKLEEAWKDHLAALSASGIIGWGPNTRLFILKEPGNLLALCILLKIVGFLLTAAAASLGAPFWFDVLGKLANARTAMLPKTGDGKAQ
jgi:hypothetical protein